MGSSALIQRGFRISVLELVIQRANGPSAVARNCEYALASGDSGVEPVFRWRNEMDWCSSD